MGKSEPQLPIHHQQEQNHHGSYLFVRCSMGFSRIDRLFSFKCVFVLLLSVAVLLTAVFSIFHLHHRQYGFDVKASIKHSATIQAYFRLQKPVAYLLPQITRLEYDIYAEIGVPYTKVAILSMHKASASDWTHVVFGVLSDPMNSSINAVSISVIRSSLVELFNQRSNLTLTTSIFGQPSSFEIFKFPGGITVIPKQSASFWMLPQALFNFTLPNSLREIEENFVELKEQLKSGLHLKPYESVYMQVTNKAGSTRDPPVTVQASIVSNLGNLVPLRLKQLAQTITGSPSARNLGLDHSVFGKVKEISLSSYLYHTLDAPSPSPAPSPLLNYYAEPSISPSPSPVFSSPSPQNGHDQSSPPLANAPVDHSCGGSHIFPSPPPMNVPVPHSLPSAPRHSISPPPVHPRSEMPPDFPSLPAVSYGSHPGQDQGDQKGSVAPPVSVSPSLSSSATGSLNHITWPLFFFSTLMTLQTLCRSADLQFC
ncbi:uncharacterized protein LOC112507866 [Cynara cardunculus var. scolymus]|uniref:uncharacterized protein LOC112507866 n=1 Tax=Cynara cardunculus var. scolymus TaxID=59895 RepID=UPI000D62A1E9|nr:uncharacterized protein LOC112507866 [Cynara cardunculus var. scolymus]